MNIVGIMGYAESGKDTIADVLVRDFGFRRIGFADALKRLAEKTDPVLNDGEDDFVTLTYLLDLCDGDWDKVKRDYPDARLYLQRLGQGIRDLQPYFWINTVLDVIETDLGASWVIPDVRHLNEVDTIRELGGEVWRVRRPGVGPANDHQSEINVDSVPADVTLHNAGTLENLRAQVHQAMTLLAA